MPDRADVEQALAGLVAGALYPNGTDADSAVGDPCRIYRGWPVTNVLSSELAQGVVHVTVQPVSGTMRDRTRYLTEWQGSVPAAHAHGSVDGEYVRFSGSGGAGQVAGIRVDGLAYAYRLRDGDAPSLVAAALGGADPGKPAGTGERQERVPAERERADRAGGRGWQGGSELRRQEAGFRVTFWCPDPDTRDQVAALVDLAMAGSTFMDVGGWACRVQAFGGSSTDENSAGGVWRRDLLYSIEYPTVANETLPAMLFGVADVNGVPFIG